MRKLRRVILFLRWIIAVSHCPRDDSCTGVGVLSATDRQSKRVICQMMFERSAVTPIQKLREDTAS